ncbi:MAG: hypothetical protein HKP58_14525, partial [Desulfatitalea sp.]|nr:hypothetical protein [Desulfatitalea sp.]NNK01621.1 hypothetical protein [Desulfatitalea sp.]
MNPERKLMFHVPEACRWIVVVCALALNFTACGNGKEAADGRRTQCRDALSSLQSRHARLNRDVARLQDEYEQLLAGHENLKVKHEALRLWSRQVASRYGPGVWYFGKAERPLPLEHLPLATAHLLSERLNRLFRQEGLPQFALVKIEGDVAFVHIADDLMLTQNMGTTGATGYIQSITYTLTSLR